MTSLDEQIGRNVARYRGDLSQKEIAEKMRHFGWKWSQATLWAVEKGERPLRLAEAHDLAAIFDMPSSNFLADDDSAKVTQALGIAAASRSRLVHAIDNYHEALFALAFEADDAETVPEVALHWLENETPAQVVREARFGVTYRPDPTGEGFAHELHKRLTT